MTIIQNFMTFIQIFLNIIQIIRILSDFREYYPIFVNIIQIFVNIIQIVKIINQILSNLDPSICEYLRESADKNLLLVYQSSIFVINIKVIK